jgi:KipI family sensor histidine kinase inhibitor
MTAMGVTDCGDSAVLVVVDGADPEQRWAVSHALAGRVRAAVAPGVHAAIPTYDRVLVEFDCTRTDHATVAALLRAEFDLLPARPAAARSRRFVIPVVYGGDHGPDLGLVAAQQGCSPEALVAMHTGTELTVRCFGSPAGSPMLDGPPFPLPVPRLGAPRTRVPAGAAAVAGRQAVVSAKPAPGGWTVLGRTPLRVLDLDATPPAAYWPGDRVRFRAIAASEWDRFAGAALEACDG